jgi:hypothetical protein
MGTPALARDAATSHSSHTEPAAPDRGRFVSLSCALAAACIAAGSTGLLGHALRHGLTLFLLAVSFVVGWPALMRGLSWRKAAALVCIAVVAIALVASPFPPVNVMASALVLAALAWARPAAHQTPFLVASTAVVVLGLYRFAVTTFPWVWLVTDQFAAAIAFLPGFISRQPLHTGATFAGMDYLVLMLTLCSLWAARLPGRKSRRTLRMAGVIFGVHLIYLVALSFAPKLLAWLPAARTEAAFGQKAPWDWAQALRSVVPWNFPALALLLHLSAAGCLFKTMPAAPASPGANRGLRARMPPLPFAVPALLVALALLIPALASLNPHPLSLEGKKIVLHEKGFLNWLKPKHGEYGRLSVGMYGMLPQFIQSYGGQCVVSPELSAADLQGAHLLALIFPNKPWAEGQLERIWNFVREGGSLLVLGEHTVREKEGGNRFNDVLQPTALRVAFDSAMFEVGGWLESYEALSHPATAGLRDHRNEFGVVIGASVEARWPARPVLVGRYGFSDPGDPANDESKGGSMMGNHKYDAGEKLGDQLLAAEQRFGRGRVMVFGDTSGFSNSILFGSHDFVSRLFGYLCSEAETSSARHLIAGLGLVLLCWCLWLCTRPGSLALTALAFSASLTWTMARNHRAAESLPDGRQATPNRLAYIDTSHLERSSGESWREDGLGGLELTLMRNGYLVLGLHEFDSERLKRAGLLISVAPGRRFTAGEIRAVREFIEGGGIFVCTVGWPEAQASRALLADLGFYVGGIGAATSGQPEPKPFGHFKAPYFNGGDYMAYVRFHAAWNVESHDPQARPVAYGPRDPKGPPDQPDPTVILMRRIGRGKAVVVADTDFATNQNLEREGGQPFEGMRENADFWRWFLDYLNDQPAWTPPKPPPPPVPTPSGTETKPKP